MCRCFLTTSLSLFLVHLVLGKGKEKVGEEQAAQVLLNLQTPKKKSSAEQYIFQRRSYVLTVTAGREESSSLYAELGLSSSDTESDEEMPSVVRSGTQDEGQAGADPGTLDEGQAGSDPGTLDEGQAGSDPGTLDEGQAGSNPDDVIPEEPVFSKPHGRDIVYSTTSAKEFSLHQQQRQPTTTLPLPPQRQQGSSDSILIKRMGELEQHIVNLVEENQALETRLTKQGSRINKLESCLKEVVSLSVKQAMRAPLRARFKNLSTSDMKEILLQRMLEENYDKGHAEHRISYKALQGSIHHDECEPPPGSPPSPPPPPPPPSGASGTFGTTGASDSAQAPPPPPPSSSTPQGDQSTGTAAPSSSKSAASAEYSAWTTTDTQIKPSITLIPDDLYMDDETTADEQAVSSDDEVGRDQYSPQAKPRQSW
ncbi:hypothetical protein Tco_1143269 [Tanacetum coccineum]